MGKSKQKKKGKQQGNDLAAQKERDRQKREAQQEKKRRQRRKTLKRIGILAASAAGLAGIVCGTVYGIRHSGVLLRNKIVMETEHFQITAAMMSCYFRECEDSYLEYADSVPNVLTFDESKSLRSQQYSDGMTWYEMFLSTCRQSARQNLQACEAAYAAGYELTDDDRQHCTDAAAEEDLSRYQAGVTVDDLRRAKEMTMLGQKYQTDSAASITVTDDELNAFYAENEQAYQTVSIYGYAVPWGAEAALEGESEERTAAEAAAQKLSECKTPEEFRSFVVQYLTEEKGVDADEATLIGETLLVTNTVGSFDADLQEFLKTAKAGETTCITHEDQAYSQVYMMISPPAKDESPTADLRVIYLAASNYDSLDEAKKTAEQLREAVSAADDPISQFAEFAANYSTDTNTNSKGGKLQGYAQSRTTYGSELTDWAFDGNRKPGDMTILARSAAAILVYYEADNPYKGWESAVYTDFYNRVRNALQQEITKQNVTAYEENEKYIDY